VLLTEATLMAYATSVPGGGEAALEPLRSLLVALGTPSFTAQVSGVDQEMRSGYAAAYIEGIRVVHLATGALAVVAGVLAWLGLGRRDPLQGMWEHQQ
jgi:hypothetical protein